MSADKIDKWMHRRSTISRSLGTELVNLYFMDPFVSSSLATSYDLLGTTAESLLVMSDITEEHNINWSDRCFKQNSIDELMSLTDYLRYWAGAPSHAAPKIPKSKRFTNTTV